MWLSFASGLPLGVAGRGQASVVQVFFIASLLNLGLLTYKMEMVMLTARTG